MAQKKEKKRIIYLELLRILAILMFMWNHSYEAGFLLFLQNQQSRFYLFYIALSVLCKAGVPLFFMISGCLLLGKEESWKQILGHRIARIVIVILLYNAGYMIYFKRDWNDYLYYLLSKSICESGWFLYSYLAFLVMLPILRKLVKCLSKKDYIGIYCTMIIVIGIFPIVEYFGQISFNEFFNVAEMLEWNVIYPILGYGCGVVLQEKEITKRRVCGCLLAGMIALLSSCLLIAHRLQEQNVCPDALFHKNMLPIITVCIFIIFRYFEISIRWNRYMQRIVQSVGECTFGIYLLEEILREKTRIVYQICLERGMVQFFAGTCWIVFAFFVGYVCTFIAKKIPIVNKLI